VRKGLRDIAGREDAAHHPDQRQAGDGRRGRDTFASLKRTSRKLGISFLHYLNDRTRGANRIATLARLIEARALAP